MRAIIAALLVLSVSGYAQSASAQCGPNDKIFIDPRLVPPPSRWTPASIAALMQNHSVDPLVRDRAMQMYMQQLTPFEMPYKGGRVLINRQNPCIQQYIPN